MDEPDARSSQLSAPPPGAMPPAERPSLSSDLRSRVVAGLAMAVLVVTLNWAGLSPFSLLLFVAGAAMSWEWSAIVRGSAKDVTFFIHAASTFAATFLAAVGLAGLGFAAVLVGAILVFVLQIGARPIISALGPVYTGVPAIALLWLRGDEPWGVWAVLFVFTVVAATDVAAFFAGRTFGGPKLAPSISPNKTWSGLIGGVAAATAAAALFSIATGGDGFALALTGCVLGAIAQAGDLAESGLKRAFGVKDASNLIPGHGGVLDRADGIIAVAVAAALYALYVNPYAPAQALMLHH